MMRDFGGSMKREDYDGVFKALGDEHGAERRRDS